MIIGGQSKKIEKSYKFSQKSETSGHHLATLIIIATGSVIFYNKLPTFAIIKID